MTDHVSPALRSRIMVRVSGKDTEPKIKVRQLVYALGYRYRLHRRRFPGTPDLVFQSLRKVMFYYLAGSYITFSAKLPINRACVMLGKLRWESVTDQLCNWIAPSGQVELIGFWKTLQERSFP